MVQTTTKKAYYHVYASLTGLKARLVNKDAKNLTLTEAKSILKDHIAKLKKESDQFKIISKTPLKVRLKKWHKYADGVLYGGETWTYSIRKTINPKK